MSATATHMPFVWVLFGAFLLELVCAYPAWLWKRVGHPVSWMAKGIDAWEVWTNSSGVKPRRDFIVGFALLMVGVSLVGGVAYTLSHYLEHIEFGWIAELALVATLLASRSLYDHVSDIAIAFTNGGLVEARAAVSKIVGRDVASLDEAGVSRAAVESLAENTSDGVIAPLFWGLVSGLPGLAIYKFVNTTDSLIGHRNARYEYFGKASARADDLMNLVPARLTGLLFIGTTLSLGKMKDAWRCMWRFAPLHLSPNAGWPEAAMAGALGASLGGPRTYANGTVSQGAWLGTGRMDLTSSDIAEALQLYKRVLRLTAAFLFVFVLLAGCEA